MITSSLSRSSFQPSLTNLLLISSSNWIYNFRYGANINWAVTILHLLQVFEQFLRISGNGSSLKMIRRTSFGKSEILASIWIGPLINLLKLHSNAALFWQVQQKFCWFFFCYCLQNWDCFEFENTKNWDRKNNEIKGLCIKSTYAKKRYITRFVLTMYSKFKPDFDKMH